MCSLRRGGTKGVTIGAQAEATWREDDHSVASLASQRQMGFGSEWWVAEPRQEQPLAVEHSSRTHGRALSASAIISRSSGESETPMS